MRSLILAFLLIVGASVQADELNLDQCSLPDAPDVPDGATAAEEEMTVAGSAVREYVAAAQAALDCLDKVRAGLGEAITPEQTTAINTTYNEGVDALNAVAENFNAQVRAFKAQ